MSHEDREVLCRLIAAIRHCLDEGHEAEEIARIIEHLLEYTKMHVLSEELLMQLYMYPFGRRHSRQHDQMIESIERLATEIDEGDAKSLRARLVDFETELEQHCGAHDARFTQFLANMDGGEDT
ncbi:MAG: hemerythrin family protein [Rhodospirillales bacterium]|nr:hemerythrin family protein [Rhodospirillales bacterium]